METLYVGTYTETHLLDEQRRDVGIRIYLHCLDPNTYVISDDVGGRFCKAVAISARVGEKVMRGDFTALSEASPEIAQLISRPHFKFADSCIITQTDPSLLGSSRNNNHQSINGRR